jgi:hypothetical protein
MKKWIFFLNYLVFLKIDKMKKIIIFLFLQISLISQIFAIDVTINTDKNIYQPNEQIILNIEISSQEDPNISIENIE